VPIGAEGGLSPTGYAMRPGSRQLAIHFKDIKMAKTWVQGQESTKAPFCFRELNDPTKVRVRRCDGDTEANRAQQQPGWREELLSVGEHHLLLPAEHKVLTFVTVAVNGPDDFEALPQVCNRCRLPTYAISELYKRRSSV
jgi:hypothetical protein